MPITTTQGPRRHRRSRPGMHSVRPHPRTAEPGRAQRIRPSNPNLRPASAITAVKRRDPMSVARKPDPRDHSARWSIGPPPADRTASPGGFGNPPNTTTDFHRAQYDRLQIDWSGPTRVSDKMDKRDTSAWFDGGAGNGHTAHRSRVLRPARCPRSTGGRRQPGLRGVDPDRTGRQALARSAVNGPVSSAPAPVLEVWPCGG